MGGHVAYTAAVGGYDGCSGVLHLEHVRAIGVESSDLGPNIIIAYEGVIHIYVIDQSYRVAS